MRRGSRAESGDDQTRQWNAGCTHAAAREGAWPMRHVLITGGAGFIGSHLADALIERGDRVRVLDSLDPQVHPGGRRPDYLRAEVDLRVGDGRDGATMAEALEDTDAVGHLAAGVGVGQSMYEVRKYTSINAVRTAGRLEALAARPVARLIVA